jgi:hypothetical protein
MNRPNNNSRLFISALQTLRRHVAGGILADADEDTDEIILGNLGVIQNLIRGNRQ